MHACVCCVCACVRMWMRMRGCSWACACVRCPYLPIRRAHNSDSTEPGPARPIVFCLRVRAGALPRRKPARQFEERETHRRLKLGELLLIHRHAPWTHTAHTHGHGEKTQTPHTAHAWGRWRCQSASRKTRGATHSRAPGGRCLPSQHATGLMRALRLLRPCAALRGGAPRRAAALGQEAGRPRAFFEERSASHARAPRLPGARPARPPKARVLALFRGGATRRRHSTGGGHTKRLSERAPCPLLVFHSCVRFLSKNI